MLFPFYCYLYTAEPVELQALSNMQSGISVSLSGVNGTDWLVEKTYHDDFLSDQILYVQSDVSFSLAHNQWNTIMKRSGTQLDAIQGVEGGGVIHYKIDRDMQTHAYSSAAGAMSAMIAPAYNAPFSFEQLVYKQAAIDGTKKVLGGIGDNGGPWGKRPLSSTERFAYGLLDAAGNEWHVLTYWDDDEGLYAGVKESSHRQGASDGHWLSVCVNPKTPIIQFSAIEGEAQFYTTPLKTYAAPRIWERESYVTAEVRMRLQAIGTDEMIWYRINEEPWIQYGGHALTIADMFPVKDSDDNTYRFDCRLGEGGPLLTRTIHVNPTHPAQKEQHGYLLYLDDTEKKQLIHKFKNISPFKESYARYVSNYYQGKPYTRNQRARKGWCAGASMAGQSLANAFAVVIDGVEKRGVEAEMAKYRLLEMARLEAVGCEQNTGAATPAKDYLNELGQTLQRYTDAGMAYDLLASVYRVPFPSDQAGMSAIEEIRIRDGLAEIAKNLLWMRCNWSFVSGSGDSHWAHGYELAIGVIAAAMPTYARPCFGVSGVSGADGESLNTYADANGKYWNPYPDQGETWWACATDPEIKTPGFPNIRGPLRSEFQISDDGYWTGPNYLQGDGSRYVRGVFRKSLVDVRYGGLANAENRIELVEMDGYEKPFVTRIHVLDNIRRLRQARHEGRENDSSVSDNQYCVGQYIMRRLVAGTVVYDWDAKDKRYIHRPVRMHSSVYAFNSRYAVAGQPKTQKRMQEYLDAVSAFYRKGADANTPPSKYIKGDGRKTFYDAYALSYCMTPEQIQTTEILPEMPPIIRPTFKYVVHPGDTVVKQCIAMDLNGQTVEMTAEGLPAGAQFDPLTWILKWTPTEDDIGVHIVQIHANDGIASSHRPFPIIVKDPKHVSKVLPRLKVVAELLNQTQAQLTWDAPVSSAPKNVQEDTQKSAPQEIDVAAYIIYRDGSFHDTCAAGQLRYVDPVPLPAGSHTRYHLTYFDRNGTEASAAVTDPEILSVPR